MTIKVYKFGLLDPVSGWDQTAIDVLFLRNKLWNNLVALEHEKRQAYRNLLLDSDTELAALQARLDAIEVEKASLTTRKNALRAKARSKQIDTSEIDQEIKKLLEERKALGGQTKDLRERVKIEVKLKRNGGTDTKLTDIARKNCNRAALSELTLYIQQACAKNGVAFEKIDTTYMTRTCFQCGHLNSANTGNLLLACEGCGAEYDQDDNAARNYLDSTKPCTCCP